MPTKAPYYPKKITSRMLQYRDACSEQVDLFKAVFPTGLEVNRQNILRAVEVGLDLVWAINFFLSDRNLDRWDEYFLLQKEARDAAILTIRKRFTRTVNEFNTALHKAVSANPEDYDRHRQFSQNQEQIMDRVRTVRDREIDAANAAFDQARAKLLADFLQLP